MSPVPGGGFVTTNFAPRGGNAVAAALKGSNSGEVWEWQSKDGWKIVPGSESPGPNGIEASRDGNWLYVNLWPVKKVMRLSRGKTPVQKDVIDLPFHPDNIRWQAEFFRLGFHNDIKTHSVAQKARLFAQLIDERSR